MKRVAISVENCIYDYPDGKSSGVAGISNKMDNQENNLKTASIGKARLEKPPVSLSDEQIMSALHGDYSSYIYSIVKNKCYSFKLANEDIEDCYIDVMIKMCDRGCRKIRQFKGESSFKTFLTVLCRNLATDYIRRETKNRERFKLIDGINEDWNDIYTLYSDDSLRDNPEKIYLTKEREKMVADVHEAIITEIEKLNDEEKLITKLRLKKNMAYREIDDFLGIDNSRYRLSKIFQGIRACIDNDKRRAIEEILSGEDFPEKQ